MRAIWALLLMSHLAMATKEKEMEKRLSSVEALLSKSVNKNEACLQKLSHLQNQFDDLQEKNNLLMKNLTSMQSTLAYLNELSKMIYVSSCEDLSNHGIQTPGWFWINPMPESFNSQPSKVFCSFNTRKTLQEVFSDKILLISGQTENDVKLAEIIDLSDDSSILVEDNADEYLSFASGGLVKGSTPIICGGGSSPTAQTDECHFFNASKDSSKIVMIEPRFGHKSSVVKEKLWITGGLTSSASTELVDPVKKISEEGPDLPYRLHNHCVITINETLAMIIGGEGFDDVKSSTYFHNFDTGEWTLGPALLQNRSAHACAILVTPSSRYIIVTGGIDSDIEELASTEVLNIDEPTHWFYGPSFPRTISFLSLVTVRNFVVANGGESKEKMQSALHKLWCITDQCKWEKLNVKLKLPRKYHISINIP